MPLNRIIIPLTVKAHLANDTNADTYKPPRWFPDYTKVYNSVLGANVTPTPFTEYNNCLKAGVHLHFILPSAFRHGSVKNDSNDSEKNEEYDFPAVPNRYVITRMYEQDGKIQVRCFIAESDFIRPELDKGEDKEAYSVIPYLDDSSHPYRFMGRWYEAENIPEGGEYLNKKLTVVMGGDPLFAAYYPTCKSVFGWHDTLEGVPEKCDLTYFVLGYFSSAEDDPFSEIDTIEKLREVLSSCNFTVEGETEELCDGCVFFGEALNIRWEGAKYPYDDMNAPTGEVDVSFGPTSAEAMSAVLAQKSSDRLSAKNFFARSSPSESLEYNFTKLQYDLLKQEKLEDGSFKADDEIHKRTFREIDPLEKYDVIRPKENTNHSAAIDLTAYIELRRLRREAGRVERKLSFTRKKLYYAWETYISRREAARSNFSEALDEINRLIDQLSDGSELMSEKSRLENEIKLKLIETEKSLPDGYELKTETAEPFVIQKDPVIMVSGEGINKVFAFDEKNADGSLTCYISPRESERLSPEDVLKKCVGLPPEFLPFDYYALLYQAVINSPKLLKIFGGVSVKEKTLSDTVNEMPLEPSQLFMDWQIKCRCTEDKASLEGWSFDFGETDYVYNGSPKKTPISVGGRIPLTPHAHKVLTEQLDNYQNKPELSKRLRDLPFISQELSGFTNELAGLRQVFQLPLSYDVHDISKEAERLVEKHRLSVRGTELFPMRGCCIGLSRLNIIGTFGQKQTVVRDSEYNNSKAFFPYYMATFNDGGDYMGMFPLFFTSETRLTAEFTAPDFKCGNTNDGSPICATILPELLNNRLMLYNQKGEYAGMLKTVFRNGKSKNIFIKSPSVPELNPVLEGFINGIMNNDASLSSLISLMQSKLDRTVRTCQSDFIWGVPLTLSQLRVRFEFFGGAEYSKEDKDFGKYDDKGAERLKIPLKFGNINRAADGTIGVYENGDFSAIYPLWGAENNDVRDYVKKEGPLISAADGDKIFTVLSVPNSDLYIETGLLPVVRTRINPMYTSAADKIIPTAEINPIIADIKKVRLPIYDGFEWQYKTTPQDSGTFSEILPLEDIITENVIAEGLIVKNEKKN